MDSVLLLCVLLEGLLHHLRPQKQEKLSLKGMQNVMSCHVMFTSKMYYMIWYPFQTQISCVRVCFVFSKCCVNVVEFSKSELIEREK